MVNERGPAQEITGTARQSGKFSPISRLMHFCAAFPVKVESYAFDRFLGVSTREPVYTLDSSGSVFTPGGESCPYSGAPWIPVRRALKGLSPGPSDVFVDLGSGKGKPLLIAGRLPYRRAIGVELDEELSRHSARNVQRARSRLRAQLVESVNASVLDWVVPDDVSVVFMFNPFIGDTFHAAIGRVFESYDRSPRTLHIVYYYPWEHDWLMRTGRVRVESVRPGSWPALPGWWRRGNVIVSYRVTGAADAVASSPGRGRSRAADYWGRPNGHRFAMSAPGHGTVYSPSA